MNTIELIVGIVVSASWISFILYWAISAIHVKQNVQHTRSWWSIFWIRIVVIAGLVWIFSTPVFAPMAAPYFDAFRKINNPATMTGMVVGVIGAVLCLLGIGFAVWARRHLGRNWSGVPSIKVGHELVTSGPYRYVRHPIYTGIILALFGSSLATSPMMFVMFIIFTAVFMGRIPKEEGYMMQLFPDQYPVYKARTKALIPFVW